MAGLSNEPERSSVRGCFDDGTSPTSTVYGFINTRKKNGTTGTPCNGSSSRAAVIFSVEMH